MLSVAAVVGVVMQVDAAVAAASELAVAAFVFVVVVVAGAQLLDRVYYLQL